MPLTRITSDNISNTTIEIQDLSVNTVNALMYTANTAVSASGVTAGTYGSIGTSPIIVVNDQGRLTSAQENIEFLLYRLNSTRVGSNATGAQSIFGVSANLETNTQYEIEGLYALSKTAGTTSHNFSIGFGGTATFNNVDYLSSFKYNTTSFLAAPTTDGLHSFIQGTTTTQILSAIVSAGTYIAITIRGSLSVNEAGTLIPQYSLSAAPGGAYTVAIGSYFKLTKVGSAGSNISVGSWS